MFLVSTDTVPGREIDSVLGLVRGNSVRAKVFIKDIMAGLRNFVGGEVNEYTELMTESREAALSRMVAEANKLGADAVVGIRFTTSQIMESAAEMFVYGTAVKLK